MFWKLQIVEKHLTWSISILSEIQVNGKSVVLNTSLLVSVLIYLMCFYFSIAQGFQSDGRNLC